MFNKPVNHVVNPLVPSLTLSEFTDAFKLLPVDPKDLKSGDVVALVDDKGSLVQIHGEKVHIVSDMAVSDNPEVTLSVIPFVPHVVQTPSVKPPFTEPVVNSEVYVTLTLGCTLVSVNGEPIIEEVVEEEEVPGEELPTVRASGYIWQEEGHAEKATQELYRVDELTRSELSDVYKPTVDDICVKGSDGQYYRIPLQVVNREHGTPTLGDHDIKVTIPASKFTVGYLVELMNQAKLYIDIRK